METEDRVPEAVPGDGGRRACALCAGEFDGPGVVRIGEEYYCKSCLKGLLEAGASGDGADRGADRPPVPQDKLGGVTPPGVSGPRHPAVVFLLSLIPGAGHMYMGLMSRGFQLMALFFGSLFLGSVGGPGLWEVWPAVVAPVLWFFSLFDSLRIVRELNKGEMVHDFGVLRARGELGLATWGWILVGFGILFLLNNLLYVYPAVSFLARRFLPALVLIGIGLFVLWRERRTAA